MTHDRSPLFRHESFDELEQRSRSLASLKPKFPLLKLPLELRLQIFSHLLPRAIENIRTEGTDTLKADHPARDPNHVIWRRGNISLLCVCRQLHDECARLMYGSNMFVLFVRYTGIEFRFCWRIPSGLIPNLHRKIDQVSTKYLALMKKVIINIDHVDSYIGMIKFNVSGKGLSHGLRKQVQRVVNALRLPDVTYANTTNSENEQPCVIVNGHRRLLRVSVRVHNNKMGLDLRKYPIVRERDGDMKFNEDVEEILEPFSHLRGVRHLAITGAVSDRFAHGLKEKIMCTEDNLSSVVKMTQHLSILDEIASPPLCVYGNDI